MKANMLKVFVSFRDKKQKQNRLDMLDQLDMADEFDGFNGVAKLNRVRVTHPAPSFR